jgi:hypothetical protein
VAVAAEKAYPARELNKSEEPGPSEPDELSLCLNRWMGRREAFGLVAGRCAAADIETLRQIREQKLYSWTKFPAWTEHFANALLNPVDLPKSFPYIGSPVTDSPGVRQLVHSPIRRL